MVLMADIHQKKLPCLVHGRYAFRMPRKQAEYDETRENREKSRGFKPVGHTLNEGAWPIKDDSVFVVKSSFLQLWEAQHLVRRLCG